MARSHSRAVLLLLVVAVVQADSSIVTLALPDILRDLNSTVGGVAWVLILFNLVLGVAAGPAAWTLRRVDAGKATFAGLLVFAASSGACALATSVPVLLVARAGQAVGGAVVLVGALRLLNSVYDGRSGLVRWTAAGVVGIAIGPVLGGLLTQALSWRATFAVQVPFALLALSAAAKVPPRKPAEERRRPVAALNVALALLSASLTAALFLLVLLLVDGFGRSPAVAAVTVSVIPAAALLVRPMLGRLRLGGRGLGGRGLGGRGESVSGCVCVAGGLVALALPPSSALAWTVPAQVLLGLGLGLTLDGLTTAAVKEQESQAGWTLGARHLGIVLGLALLTPVFTADLQSAQTPAEQAVVSLVLDAPLSPQTKVDLADRLSAQLSAQQGRVPDLHPAFKQLKPPPGEAAAAHRLRGQLDGQLRRAADRAFRTAFLLAAGLALVALVPLLVRSPALPGLALVLVAAVLGGQVLAGGGQFVPTKPTDPCRQRPITGALTTLDQLTQAVVLLGADGAACRLHVTREALVLELAQPGPRSQSQVNAVRAGLDGAVDRLDREHRLPKASALADEAIDSSSLNPFLKRGLHLLPNSLIDSRLHTGDLLHRAVAKLNVRDVLQHVQDPDRLNQLVGAAVQSAVKDEVLAGLP